MRYTVRNKTINTIVLPYPVTGKLGPNQEKVFDGPAGLLEIPDGLKRKNKWQELINSGIIELTSGQSPEVSSDLQFASKQYVDDSGGGGGGNYLIVEDETERDAIPVEDRVAGMLVYIKTVSLSGNFFVLADDLVTWRTLALYPEDGSAGGLYNETGTVFISADSVDITGLANLNLNASVVGVNGDLTVSSDISSSRFSTDDTISGALTGTRIGTSSATSYNLQSGKIFNIIDSSVSVLPNSSTNISLALTTSSTIVLVPGGPNTVVNQLQISANEKLAGRKLTIINGSGTLYLAFSHNSGSSDNSLNLPSTRNFYVAPRGGVELIYNTTLSRWTILSGTEIDPYTTYLIGKSSSSSLQIAPGASHTERIALGSLPSSNGSNRSWLLTSARIRARSSSGSGTWTINSASIVASTASLPFESSRGTISGSAVSFGASTAYSTAGIVGSSAIASGQSIILEIDITNDMGSSADLQLVDFWMEFTAN